MRFKNKSDKPAPTRSATRVKSKRDPLLRVEEENLKNPKNIPESKLEQQNLADSLTERQLAALRFIAKSTRASNSPPTLRELCLHMGYSSIGSAQDVVAVLRKKGFLHLPERQSARALSLTALATALLSGDQSGLQLENRFKVEGNGANGSANRGFEEVTYFVPILGKVAAGLPAEAISHVDESFELPLSLLPRTERQFLDKLFALVAKGDSMIGAGIFENDILIVRKASQASLGKIVVARMDEDATVKRLGRDARGFFLQAENPNYKPIYAAEVDFEISGEVIALVRRF
jgi:repressor LexA